MQNYTTLKKLSEQILRRYQDGNVQSNSDLTEVEVKVLVVQSMMKLLKVQRMENMSEMGVIGVEIPEMFIATYALTPATDATRKHDYVTLPAAPIKMKMGMGIWSVCEQGKEDQPYIPIPTGMKWMLKDIPAGGLEGEIGYETEGFRLIFTKPVTKMDVSTVTVKLAIYDFSNFTDTDALPLSQDLEIEVIKDVLNTLRPQSQHDELVDSVDQD